MKLDYEIPPLRQIQLQTDGRTDSFFKKAQIMDTNTNTATDVVDIKELLDVCVEVAERAGVVIRHVRASGDLDAVEKHANDPVTRADFAAQTLIFGTLRARWPRLPLVGEEDEARCARADIAPLLALARTAPIQTAPDATVVLPPALRTALCAVPVRELCVYVDPLDGTREYTRGRDEPVMVLIGVTRGGVPLAGVTHQPFVDAAHGGRTLTAVVGAGACAGLHPGPYAGADTLLLTTETMGAERAERVRAQMGVARVAFVGGCANKMLHVVEGRASCMMNAGCFVWDTCAVEALARACGGVATDLDGHDLVYPGRAAPNARGVFVSMLPRAQHLAVLRRFHENQAADKQH